MSALPLTSALRSLGPTTLQVSPMAWGMWRFAGTDVATARAKIDAAFEAGINFFDTADIYGADTVGFGSAEALLGKVFAEDRSLRDRMILASKGGIEMGVPYNSSSAYLHAAVDASLTRLGVERLDLWQIHRPDTLAHPAEVARALDDLRRAGKIREVGVSNHTTSQTAALQAFLPFPIATDQPEFSPVAIGVISDGTLDQAMARNMSVLAWSPLGQGRLGDAGGGDERAVAVVKELDRIATREGVSRTSVAYAWIMAHPAKPIPIVGSQNPDRIRESKEAYRVSLTRTDWYAVLTAARGVRLP